MSSSLQYGISIEIERWCIAVQNFPGEIDPKLIYKVIKQLQPHFKTAVEGNAILNLVVIGQRLAEAGKYCVSEQDIIAGLAGMLPGPDSVSPGCHLTLAQTLGLVEQVLPGTLDRIKEHWQIERMRTPRAA